MRQYCDNEIIPIVNPQAGRLPGRNSSQIILPRPGSLGLPSYLVQRSALQLGPDHLTWLKFLKTPLSTSQIPSARFLSN